MLKKKYLEITRNKYLNKKEKNITYVSKLFNIIDRNSVGNLNLQETLKPMASIGL